MAQPSRIIYLPPGVVPAPQVMAQPQSAQPSGLPFDRQFFEQVLAGSIASFCQQADCNQPVVELLTVDGVTHYVRGISGVSDTWVALHTRVDHHEEDIQVFIPYATIFRVAIHPAEDERRRGMGFLNPPIRQKRVPEAPSEAPPGTKTVSPPEGERPAAQRRKKQAGTAP